MILADTSRLSIQGNASLNFNPLGLSEEARNRLRALSGHEPELSYLPTEQKTHWSCTNDLESLRHVAPMFITMTWRAPDPEREDRWLHLSDMLWIDIDSKGDIEGAVAGLKQAVQNLEQLGVPIGCCSLFASGGKGFHVAIPLALIVPLGISKIDLATARTFSRMCREFFLSMAVHHMDFTIYAGGKGHLIRQAGVQRANGLYKVPLAWDQWQCLDNESYHNICSAPRAPIQAEPVNSKLHAIGAGITWLTVYKTVNRPPKQIKRSSVHLDSCRNLTTSERSRIVTALKRCLQLDSYGDWLSIGMALKSTGAGDAFDLWDAFSKAQGHRQYRRAECESKWEGFAGGVTIATLFYLAKNGGRS
ncbi:MAG: PriCT-2 domain-containing protein [Rhodoferax sp.]|nr:PriCT-2 domain-containing protein [Rhodoferax sp.]MCF8211117.1 PriCT-2 domain-containing protein [Rhodoferax sp.]